MGRPKKKLYEDQLKEKYNGKIENLEPYVNLNTKILHRCNLHKHNFRSTPASVLGSKHGCPKCGEEAHKMKAKSRMAYTDEEYKQILYERFDGNIICLEEMQGMNHSILHKCLKHNFEYYTSPSSTLHASCGCRHCATETTKEKTMTSFEEFNKKVIDYSDGKYEACEDYSGYNKMMHFRHILPNGDSHIFEMIPSSFFRGGKCYCENEHLNKLIVGVNDIASKRPEIVNWLHNKDDATKYPYTSKEKIHWNCPNCNALLYKTISDVYYKGLSCPFCSDGISYPNKLIYNILKEVESDLDFLDREYQPEWCNFTMSNGSQRNGKYDIYFEKDGKKYIVEMDGGFHFKEHNYSDLSVDEVQEIDKLKDKVFNIQTQYKLLKLIKIADEEYPIYMEQFQSLLDSYAEKDDQGNIIHSEDGGTKIKKNKMDILQEKLYELKQIKVQVPDLYFSLDELEKLELKMEELNAFIDLIK